jgi:phosphatidylserine/phosphatidylglycerophosphate/cardiolipin synthase-like enzyme
MSYASSGITVTVIPDGTGDAKGLLTAMQNAKAAVHMEMYLLSNSTYISALESLSKSIDVKVVLNQTFPTGTASAQTNASSYSTLMGAGVNVKWAPANPDGSASGYTHEKAVIIDPGTSNEQVWIMTMNLDTDAPKDNREYLAEDTNSADVAEAESIFEADYSGSPAAISGSLVVAPVNAETMLLDLIETAKTSIDVEAEEIDESGQEGDLFSALTAKAKSGVAVRLVIEDSTEASQATAVSDLTAAGAKVVGYVYGSGLDIHAKTLVVDGATAYVGSENFTGGSLGYNRELGVIFTEASEVAKIESAIGTDFAGGSAYSSQ